jgi:hypothetical protein
VTASRHTDNGVTCCRARRETAAGYYAGRCPRWLWVRLPFWAHPALRLRQRQAA